nr:MAG TPA: pre-mRNA processing factor 4 (PRP4) like [Caudoviricetes sp.]DAX27254.1 MAG TPA: pre-mRNA processing factor 4 (PRP4) like [Caudoviricetes sp.]DAX94499.1 MAG TPA: pre-mRNA processing factor 4 (PRP4) like [Caudoviricetes sp.]
MKLKDTSGRKVSPNLARRQRLRGIPFILFSDDEECRKRL